MLDRQTAPLEIARTVLRPETIREVRSAAFTNSAYLILDRWALNQPDDLRRRIRRVVQHERQRLRHAVPDGPLQHFHEAVDVGPGAVLGSDRQMADRSAG